MITQEHLTKILLAAPNEDGTKTLAAPEDNADASGTTAVAVPEDLSAPSAFTQVLAEVSQKGDVAYSETNLPPTPPFKRPQHILKVQEGAVPHDPNAYYPA